MTLPRWVTVHRDGDAAIVARWSPAGVFVSSWELAHFRRRILARWSWPDSYGEPARWAAGMFDERDAPQATYATPAERRAGIGLSGSTFDRLSVELGRLGRGAAEMREAGLIGQLADATHAGTAGMFDERDAVSLFEHATHGHDDEAAPGCPACDELMDSDR